jgi:hypothetical protein
MALFAIPHGRAQFSIFLYFRGKWHKPCYYTRAFRVQELFP